MKTNVSAISFFNPLYLESSSFLRQENKVFQIFITNMSERLWSNPISNKSYHIHPWGITKKEIQTVNKVMHIGLMILLGVALVKYTLPATLFLLISALSKISNRMHHFKIDITNIENLIKSCIDKMNPGVAKESASIKLIKHYLSKNTLKDYETAISIIDTYPWTDKIRSDLCVVEYYLRKNEPACAEAYIKSITLRLDPSHLRLYEPIFYHLINNCRFRECQNLMIELDLTQVDNPLGVNITTLLKKQKEFKTLDTLNAFFTKDYNARVKTISQARKEKLQIAAIKFYLAIDLLENAKKIIETSLIENPGSDIESNGVKARGDELLLKYYLEKNDLDHASYIIQGSYPAIYHENNRSAMDGIVTGTNPNYKGNRLLCKGDFQVDLIRHLGKNKSPLLDETYQSFIANDEWNDKDSYRKRELKRAYILAKVDCEEIDEALQLIHKPDNFPPAQKRPYSKAHSICSALIDYYLRHNQKPKALEIAKAYGDGNEALLSQIDPEKPSETHLDRINALLKAQDFETADAEIRKINDINSTEYVDAIFAFLESAKNQVMIIK